ncbi:hypothetical protein, partial [Streptomyces goshikiensis]|uniref:hypothetical protein n=1 Tax=Streptomyces goshikiensis TaxID=1942 RepID=UPI003648B950
MRDTGVAGCHQIRRRCCGCPGKAATRGGCGQYAAQSTDAPPTQRAAGPAHGAAAPGPFPAAASAG